MQHLIETFRAEIDALLPEIIAFRQARHREPELACREYTTRAAIADALQGEALSIREPLIGTDLIAEFGAGDRLVLLRADIDGVATQEQTDLPYRSIHDGVMHACGHDGHAALLVGAAKVLARHQNLLPHRVRCVFQPGEEIRAAGRDLVQAGCCDGADEAYAIHDWPGYPAGAILCREGAILAAASFFTITVTGRGCHGAEPRRGNNPIPIAARLITRLHKEHERLYADGQALISVCAAHAGTVGNVIPDQAVLHGTARYLRPEMADAMEAIIRRACDDIAADSCGATITLDYSRNYEIPVMNTPAGYAKVRGVAETAFGPGGFLEMTEPSMGGEDFAYYLPGRDGALLLLGQGEDRGNLHANTFNFNDDSLANGILTLCLLAAT
jgi:amidohydrolase